MIQINDAAAGFGDVAGMDMLGSFAALCTSGGRGDVLAGLFVAGVAGSALHCAPMCGGFVLGQVADGMARLPASRLCEWRRLSTGALLPYHLGRLTTYALLGALAAGSSAVLMGAAWLRGLSAGLLTLAALVFLVQAAARLTPFRALSAPSVLTRHIVALSALARRAGRFPLGMALGLLPCGLVYGALLAAAASGDPVAGALRMVAFGLGTVPALVVVGVLGHNVGRRWQTALSAGAPVIFGGSALVLLALAWQEALGLF